MRSASCSIGAQEAVVTCGADPDGSGGGAALAFAYTRRLDGLSLLTAVVAANECAARITAS
ncbi:hypothetical protein ACWERY_40435, partial [Streptomyces sp. NPDC004082]